MFLCLFSGVELVVRDAQGGVSVYNVETNKHRVLLTSSSFVSANLLVSTEHTVFADWRQICKAIRDFFYYYFSHSELRFHVLAWIVFKGEKITANSSCRRINGLCLPSTERPIDSNGFWVIPKRLTGI